MLERASTCLESGGRQLLRAPKPCLRTRRMLHSAFWHHGASDLILPAWWSPPSNLDHAPGDAELHERSRAPARTYDGPLLDFLYPEKTLAFIRRLSSCGTDTADLRRRTMLGPGARKFSTSRWQPPSEEDVNDPEVVQAVEEKNQLLLTANADQALRNVLWSSEPEKQELAWHLYSALADPNPPSDLLCDLMDYLAGSDATRTTSRLLQIFDQIPPENRRSSSYRIAVTAYVTLRMVGPAIQLLEEASQRFNPTHTGIDAVLKRTIQDDQWDLSFRVFKIFLHSADRDGAKPELWHPHGEEHRNNWNPIFGQAQHVLEPVEHLKSFLEHMRQFHHELNSTKEEQRVIELFANGYVSTVMSHVINMPDPDEDYINKWFTDLFRDLRNLKFPTWSLYHYSIGTFLDTPRYHQYTNEDKIFLDLYMTFRKEYEDGGHVKPPSRYLLNKLITQHGRFLSYVRVDAMVADLRAFHPNDPFARHLLNFLISFYARGGLVHQVHEFFQIFQEKFSESVDLTILTSLVYVYARRKDITGAIQQFKRITEEFSLVPDTVCWNTLLLAFTRADDLDGALECFNNCLESEVKPDLHTFGPMLDLCAARGDVEAFEALFTRAKQLNVPVETDSRARSGYVVAFLNAGDPEGAETIAHGIRQSWEAGTLDNQSITHVFNLLITYYGVKGELSESRRVYSQMIANKIPLDSWTYGALMRAMTESYNTNAAFKILRVTMPANKVRVYAFHYALVITGYLRENQPRKAKRAYQRMKGIKLPQTQSSRQASLLNKGVQELLKLRAEKSDDPRTQLQEVEQELRRSIMDDYGHEIANNQPGLRRYIDSPELNSVPQGYFALVIMLYTARGAYDIAKQLFEAASKLRSEDQDYSTPISLLTAAMETHWKIGDYDEVERCWELARAEATRLTKTFNQVMHPDPSTPEFDSIIDPSIKARFDASRIATNRRQILFRATRTYIRSLLDQDEPHTIQKAQRTINNLLTNGFIVDNLTWNEFIQHLATRKRIVDAFSACEMYLMPSFPGWATLSPFYLRRWRPSYSYMELRHYDVKRTSVLPRYKTLVVLAAVWAKVKRDEQNGLGFNPDLGGWVREVVERIAPETVGALETMPRTGDPLQRRYLEDGAGL